MTFALGIAVFGLVALLVISAETVSRLTRGRFATLADVARWLHAHPVPRAAMFVSWAFTGWHFFVR